MPSFIVHSIVGREIVKKLNITEKEKDYFFVANLLPDVNQNIHDHSLDDKILRNQIKREKQITHFKINITDTFEYPNLNLFLQKYGNDIKNNVITFGYFFHLYTDYYYFKNFFPRLFTNLDENKNVTNEKDKIKYVRINRTGEIVDNTIFWSKKNDNSIYNDYSKLNKYLIEKYNFKYDYNKYKNIVNSNEFKINIEEIKIDYLDHLLQELDDFYKEAKEKKLNDFRMFSKEEIDLLIIETIDSFIKTYNILIK